MQSGGPEVIMGWGWELLTTTVGICCFWKISQAACTLQAFYRHLPPAAIAPQVNTNQTQDNLTYTEHIFMQAWLFYLFYCAHLITVLHTYLDTHVYKHICIHTSVHVHTYTKALFSLLFKIYYCMLFLSLKSFIYFWTVWVVYQLIWLLITLLDELVFFIDCVHFLTYFLAFLFLHYHVLTVFRKALQFGSLEQRIYIYYIWICENVYVPKYKYSFLQTSYF